MCISSWPSRICLERGRGLKFPRENHKKRSSWLPNLNSKRLKILITWLRSAKADPPSSGWSRIRQCTHRTLPKISPKKQDCCMSNRICGLTPPIGPGFSSPLRPEITLWASTKRLPWWINSKIWTWWQKTKGKNPGSLSADAQEYLMGKLWPERFLRSVPRMSCMNITLK